MSDDSPWAYSLPGSGKIGFTTPSNFKIVNGDVTILSVDMTTGKLTFNGSVDEAAEAFIQAVEQITGRRIGDQT